MKMVLGVLLLGLALNLAEAGQRSHQSLPQASMTAAARPPMP